MFFIPFILLIVIVGLSYFLSNSPNSLIWTYLIISVGSSLLLFVLLFVGMIGFDGGGGHGDVGSADGGDVGAHHADVSTGDTGVADATGGPPPFILSPSTFLIISALFGAFGIITFNLLSFLPVKVRDFSSIILSAILSGTTYIYVIRMILKFLKTYSMVKTTYYYEGKEAEVLYDIPEDGFGKINIRTDDKMEQLLAKSEDGSPIPAGTIVRVKKHMGTFVIVEKV
ncbi:MAG: NfeD family protein [Candidatus Calescibacterium sp.]|nr:NfeD family protein [Candidatus Calescibacterium sp.]MDW8132127.1 NfeD family protein [Candidatus Calescibacterium sp.]